MFWVIAIIVFVIIIIGAIAQSNANAKKENERKDAIAKTISSTPDFTVSRKVEGLKGLYSFLVDDSRKKIMIVRGASKTIIPFNNIISVEMTENSNVITQKSLGGTVGGAVVGGVLAGGAGAIIGGLSSTAKQNSLISSVKVKMLLRNCSEPSITLECFNAMTMTVEGKPIKPDSMESYIYRQGLQHAQRITDILSVIIDSVQQEVAQTAPQVQSQSQPSSVADELTKLADLKEKGILSEQEFMEQKAKLLAAGVSPQPAASQPEQIVEVDPIKEEITRLVMDNKVIDAIKYYRDTVGCDLSTAKDYVTPIVEAVRGK